MAQTILTESAVLTEASPLMSTGQEAGDKGIWRTRIIEADVQGSSGYYPADVLRRDGPGAFPAGTHVYLDHPTHGEDQDRPERSVKDLAGYLVDGAQYEDSTDGKGLFARVQFIPEIKERIKSLAPVIGLSIRAAGEVENERSTGRRIVRSIAEGLSVDVVTRAGAGGRLVTMTESTAPDSPPAEQAAPQTPAATETIPSTSGTGALLNEVASLRSTTSDQIEALTIEVGRLSSQLRESMKELKRVREEHTAIRETMSSLNDRQVKADEKIGESESIQSVLSSIIESRLPLASQTRLAKSYYAGQDIHEAIETERTYAKKLFRESQRGSLSVRDDSDDSGLGLAESSSPKVDFSLSSSDEDYSDLESMLSGKVAL